MKNFATYSLYLALSIIAITPFTPALAVKAPVYPAGSLLRADTENSVYYIAQDGKRYSFPNRATYATWLPNFSALQVIPIKTMRTIPVGKTVITARPGVKLLRFDNKDTVYALSSGAHLHRFQSDDVAVATYGKNWKRKIITLPASDFPYYVLGENVTSSKNYNVIDEKNYSDSFDKELAARGLFSLPGTGFTRPNENGELSTLKQLSENLKKSLSPNFTSDITSYIIYADYDEHDMQLRAVPTNPASTITINNIPVPIGSPFTVTLPEGNSDYAITVDAPNSKPLTYTVYVRRAVIEDNALLSSLRENVVDSFSPSFSSNRFDFTLNSRFQEGILRLTPTLQSKKARIIVNNTYWTSGQTYPVQLALGKNVINITVVAESGRTLTYTLNVERAFGPSFVDAELTKLSISTRDSISKSFRSSVYDYTVHALATEKQTTISATPRTGSAKVRINGIETRSLRVDLYQGSNDIRIEVESAEGLVQLYTIHVNRD